MANEKRLIDANAMLAKNEEAYRTSEENPAGNFISTILFHSLNKMIHDAPTVDAVEVVRCKDCKHRYKNDDFVCIGVRDDDFCSYGERKDNES